MGVILKLLLLEVLDEENLQIFCNFYVICIRTTNFLLQIINYFIITRL